MRRPLLAALAAGVLAASLGGCVSLLPKTKPSQLYRFGADATDTAQAATESRSGADKIGVVLGSIGFPRASTSDGILTVRGDETAYIAGVRWVAPARLLFEEAIQRAFEHHAQRAQIVDVGDVGPASAILRVDVTSFEVRYQGGAPTVVVALAARLTRSDGRVLDQRAFSEARPADSNSVSAIVRAFDGATARVLSDVTAWTDAEVGAIPAPTSMPPQAVSPTITTSSSSTSTTTTTSPTPRP